MHKYYSTTVTDTVADKQCMVHACNQKFLGQQTSFDQLIATDWYSARRCLESKIRKKNKIHKCVISSSSIVKRQAWSKIVALHFHCVRSIHSENSNLFKSHRSRLMGIRVFNSRIRWFWSWNKRSWLIEALPTVSACTICSEHAELGTGW